MKYRQIGKYGIKVSEIGLGSWLTYGMGIDNKTAIKCIKASLDNGIIFFDTADVYNKGEAERTFGKILFKELDIRREDLVIATKCFFQMSENPNNKGLSRKHIHESVIKSLKRLKTDYIDIYQCHRHDPETPMEEICRSFNDIILQGKILYWGVSEWTAENIDEAINVCERYNLHKPISNQPQYNIIKPQIETNGVLNTCRKHGLGQVVWSPLAEGLLTGKYSEGEVPADSRAASDKMNFFIKEKIKNHDLLNKAHNFKQLAESLNLRASQLALAWCLRKSSISSAITSASKPEQITENCGAVDIQFTVELESKIKEIFTAN